MGALDPLLTRPLRGNVRVSQRVLAAIAAIVLTAMIWSVFLSMPFVGGQDVAPAVLVDALVRSSQEVNEQWKEYQNAEITYHKMKRDFEKTEALWNSAHRCLTDTGGTCFLARCSPDRGDTICSTDWYMCLCQPGLCSTVNGTCLRPDDFNPPSAKLYKLRNQLSCFAAATPLAVLLRSEVLSPVYGFLGSLMLGSRQVDRLDWQIESTKNWADVAHVLGYSATFAIIVGVFKVAFFHLAQPIGFYVLFVAYSEYMSPFQRRMAYVVLWRECMYGVLVAVAVAFKPVFLLYQPHRMDNKKSMRFFDLDLVYLLAPEAYILIELMTIRKCGKLCELAWVMFLVEGTSLVGDLCAGYALFLGLSNYGAMWPALIAGYLMSIVAFPFNLRFFLKNYKKIRAIADLSEDIKAVREEIHRRKRCRSIADRIFAVEKRVIVELNEADLTNALISSDAASRKESIYSPLSGYRHQLEKVTVEGSQGKKFIVRHGSGFNSLALDQRPSKRDFPLKVMANDALKNRHIDEVRILRREQRETFEEEARGTKLQSLEDRMHQLQME